MSERQRWQAILDALDAQGRLLAHEPDIQADLEDIWVEVLKLQQHYLPSPRAQRDTPTEDQMTPRRTLEALQAMLGTIDRLFQGVHIDADWADLTEAYIALDDMARRLERTVAEGEASLPPEEP